MIFPQQLSKMKYLLPTICTSFSLGLVSIVECDSWSKNGVMTSHSSGFADSPWTPSSSPGLTIPLVTMLPAAVCCAAPATLQPASDLHWKLISKVSFIKLVLKKLTLLLFFTHIPNPCFFCFGLPKVQLPTVYHYNTNTYAPRAIRSNIGSLLWSGYQMCALRTMKESIER